MLKINASPVNSTTSTIDALKNHENFETNNLIADCGEPPGWWIEIFSAQPPYMHYFGAFETEKIAKAELSGFVEDLANEGAQGLVSRIQFYHSSNLAIEPKETHSQEIPHFPPGIDIYESQKPPLTLILRS